MPHIDDIKIILNIKKKNIYIRNIKKKKKLKNKIRKVYTPHFILG